MTITQILNSFHIFTDDMSELSTEEEIVVLNKAVQTILNDRQWEFMRKTYTGSVANSEITIPSDFNMFMPNFNDNTEVNYPLQSVVYISNDKTKYMPHIPYGSRNQKQGAYIDKQNGKIKFTEILTNGTQIEFDYNYTPVPISTINDTIPLPQEVHHYLGQIMAIDDDIIQKSEKARSNIDQNNKALAQLMSDLRRINTRYLNI
jgi:hypothetical protein